MTKEWQEASNERAKEMRINPISGMFSCSWVMGVMLTVPSGISSEEYKGKGFVTQDK